MKLTKILQEVISEVGEGTSKPYPYVRNNPRSEYNTLFTFESDSGNKYRMTISKDDDPYEQGSNELDYDISFGVEIGSDDDGPLYSFDKEVNQGELFRVMATVIDASKKELAIDQAAGRVVNTIFIYPTKRYDMYKGDTDDSDLRRSKLYQAYIKKQAPQGSEVHVAQNGDIEIMLPEKTTK